MRKYVSAAEWRDLTDGHVYRKGEEFPFDGRQIPAERLAELENGHNRAGLVLISACEAPDDQAEAPKEETPEKASEGRKTAAKKTTKTKK